MNGLWMVLVSLVFAIEIPSANIQDVQNAKTLIGTSHKLAPSDISQLLKGIKSTNSGKGFRGSGRMSCTFEFQFGDDGEIRFSRQRMRGQTQSGEPASRSDNHDVDLDITTEYTGEPARSCAGASGEGTLVIEYIHSPDGWMVNGRPSQDSGVMHHAMRVYSLPESEISDAGLRDVRGRRARGFRFRYADSATEAKKWGDTTEILYVDVESLLWVRWELEVNLTGIPSYVVEMECDPALDLQPPCELKVSHCIQGRWHFGLPPNIQSARIFSRILFA